MDADLPYGELTSFEVTAQPDATTCNLSVTVTDNSDLSLASELDASDSPLSADFDPTNISKVLISYPSFLDSSSRTVYLDDLK